MLNRSVRRAVYSAIAAVTLTTMALVTGSSPGSADDVPDLSPSHPVFVPEIADNGLLRDLLIERFPNTFAGLVNNGDNTLTLFQTDDDPALAEFIYDRYRQYSSRGSVAPPSLRVQKAGVTIQELRGLKDQIQRDAKELEAKGIIINGVGIRDSDNSLVVNVKEDNAMVRSELYARYGAARLKHIFAGSLETQADKYADSPPWNGADALVSEELGGGQYAVCTSGFGVKRGTDRFLLTAGHCGQHFWWNSPFFPYAPLRTSSRFVGWTDPADIRHGEYAGVVLDTSLVTTPSGSSRIIWSGSVPTRKYMSGWVGVAQGDPSCIEGVVPPVQSCGGVFSVDYGTGNSEYLVGITNGNYTKGGDSGAPSWRDSGFGPVAQGTHVGRVTGADQLAVEQKINVALYVWGVSLNTVNSP